MFRSEGRHTAFNTPVHNVVRLPRAWFRWGLTACLLPVCSLGCRGGENIGVDLSADTPRFIIHRPVLGWPFLWPMVNAFVIASDEDGAVWELRSTDPSGLPARQLAIIYGRVPSGFYQVVPDENAAPKALRHGRIYYVGATGPKAVFRTVFSLPISPQELPKPSKPVPRTSARDGR